MSHLIACVFSALTAATATTVYFVRTHEVESDKADAERLAGTKLVRQLGYTEGQLMIVTAERDALRREYMKGRTEWWKIPAATDDVVHEHIPAPDRPFPIPTK